MMKTKRILAALCALAMAFCITACGDVGGTPDASTPNADSGSADSLWNKTFEGVTLKRILWYEPSDSEKQLVKESPTARAARS